MAEKQKEKISSTPKEVSSLLAIANCCGTK